MNRLNVSPAARAKFAADAVEDIARRLIKLSLDAHDDGPIFVVEVMNAVADARKLAATYAATDLLSHDEAGRLISKLSTEYGAQR